MYETYSGSNSASLDFIDSAAAMAASGSQYLAMASNIWQVATYLMSIKITFAGGGVYRYAPCSLTLVCGPTSQTLTFMSQTI
jgi:hypothetical protein